jgi:hypothetical protein
MTRPSVRLGRPLPVILATGCTTMRTGFGASDTRSEKQNSGGEINPGVGQAGMRRCAANAIRNLQHGLGPSIPEEQ